MSARRVISERDEGVGDDGGKKGGEATMAGGAECERFWR